MAPTVSLIRTRSAHPAAGTAVYRYCARCGWWVPDCRHAPPRRRRAAERAAARAGGDPVPVRGAHRA